MTGKDFLPVARALNGRAGFSSTLARRASEGLACAAG